jgi:hypothetical protein
MAGLVHTDPSHDDHYGRRLSEAQAMMRDHLQACGYCEQAVALAVGPTCNSPGPIDTARKSPSPRRGSRARVGPPQDTRCRGECGRGRQRQVPAAKTCRKSKPQGNHPIAPGSSNAHRRNVRESRSGHQVMCGSTVVISWGNLGQTVFCCNQFIRCWGGQFP